HSSSNIPTHNLPIPRLIPQESIGLIGLIHALGHAPPSPLLSPSPPLPLPLFPASHLIPQESIGLIHALGHFGPRSSSNLSYWGLAGCVNNASMLDY
ncbi:unnamed protein product, partial [Closterium sp. NIES-54]